MVRGACPPDHRHQRLTGDFSSSAFGEITSSTHNIVVRYLTGDHPDQSARARAVVDAGPVFVPVTVLLEVEWVLRSAYRQRPPDIARALRAFGGLPGVTYDEALIVAEALDSAERGMDFADALHLGKSGGDQGFMTFDHRLIKAAEREGIEGVMEP